MNKLVSFVLVFALIFVGFGMARLDTPVHAKFSELVEPVFDTVSSLSSVAHDVFDNLFPDARVTDDTIPISLDNVTFISLRAGNDFSSFYKYLYTFSVKRQGVWHELYCVRFDVIPDFSFQAVAPMYLCVYDADSSHYFKGKVLERTFGLATISGYPYNPGLLTDGSIRKSTKPTQTSFTYSSLASVYSLFSNISSEPGGTYPSGPDTSGGPGEPGWDDGGQVT